MFKGPAFAPGLFFRTGRAASVGEEVLAQIGLRNEPRGLPIDGVDRTYRRLTMDGDREDVALARGQLPHELGMASPRRHDLKSETHKDAQHLPRREPLQPGHYLEGSPCVS